ncbi:glycosyltransferase [Gammaproteobacteria bacterium]|nr:glycosyltransferase [Gammaproteobacteria bacterium]
MSSHVKKIKVLHVVDLLKTGGVEVMFMQYISAVISLNPNVEHSVFALRITEQRKDDLSALGVKLYYPVNNKYHLFRRIKIRNLIARESFDIVHGQNSSGNLWGAIGVVFQKTKLIAHEHGGAWGARGLHVLLSRIWASMASIIICNSLAAETIIRKKIYDKDKFKVIYNGVKIEAETTEKKTNGEHFKILFVGRLEEVKGIKELLEALKQLKQNNIQFQCNILGDGSRREWMSNYVERNGLNEFVSFKGLVSSVGDYMSSSDVLVLPSLREPLGNVIIEAANFKLPVIASNVDGIRELVQNNVSGILLNPTHPRFLKGLPKHVVGEFGKLVTPMAIDSNELVQALMFLKESPDVRRSFGAAAHALLRGFTIHAYARSISETYTQVSAKK